MKTMQKKMDMRLRRKRRIRKKISGTAGRPRISVFRSLRHLYVQVIDDENGQTLAATSTLDPQLKENLDGLDKKGAAKKVGQRVAELCKAKNITTVVFDRNGFRYHGRVSSLAQAAREAGLEF